MPYRRCVRLSIIPSLSPWMCECEGRLDGKTVVITGASSGIGEETAADLAKRGARVLMACRDIDKAERVAEKVRALDGVSAENVIVMRLDLSDLSSVREFAVAFKARENNLHVLVNNAGVAHVPLTYTKDGLEMHMAVNHFGHFLLTNLLLENLKASAPSTVINVSSNAQYLPFSCIDLEDLHYRQGRYYNAMLAYSQSKIANVLFTKELAKRLRDYGVTVNAVHPGNVSTGIAREYGQLNDIIKPVTRLLLKSPLEGAQSIIHLAVSSNMADITGEYFNDCDPVTPNRAALDVDIAAKLWLISLNVCKEFL